LLTDEWSQDILIRCGEETIGAHRLVLAACSQWFRGFIRQLEGVTKPLVVFWDTEMEDMKLLLRYMYLGEVRVDEEKLVRFLRFATNLKVKGLTLDDSTMEEDPNPQESDDEEPPLIVDLGQESFSGSRPRHSSIASSNNNNSNTSLENPKDEDTLNLVKEFSRQPVSIKDVRSDLRTSQTTSPCSSSSNSDLLNDNISSADPNLFNILETELTERLDDHNYTSKSLNCKGTSNVTDSKTDEMEACKDCGKLMKVGYMRTHRRNVHSGETFFCTPCNKTFSSKQTLNQHKKSRCPDRFRKKM